MASNSFKVKNSLVLTPKDLSTLTSPEAGDLACDINDNNKIKRYDANAAAWVEVGSGGVGGVDIFFVQDFESTSLSSFTQTGLVLSQTDPLKGKVSAVLNHQAGTSPTNDQKFKQIIPVDRKFRGQSMVLRLDSKSDASQGNLVINIYDETNSANLVSSEQLQLSNDVNGRKTSVSFTIPETCASLSYTITALPESGKVSRIDDIICELSESALLETSVVTPNVTAWQGYTPTFQGFGTPSAIEFEWRQVGENVEIRGKFVSGTPSAVEARIGLPAGLTSAGTNLIPSLQQIGAGNASAAAGRSASVLIEPSVTYMTFGYVEGGSGNWLTKANGNAISASSGSQSFFASVPCAGLSATSTKTIPLTQSGLVTNPDSYIRVNSSLGNGSTNTFVRRFSNVLENIGNAFTYTPSATLGDTLTVNYSGNYTITYVDGTGTLGTGMGISKNFSTNTSPLLIPAANRLQFQYTEASANWLDEMSWSGYLAAGDVLRFHNSVSTVTTSNPDGVQFTASYQGSLKQVSVSSDQKITIPTSELRMEGASSRGSTATAIVRFDTTAKLRGDAFTVESDSVLGTRITMKKAGKLDVSTTIFRSGSTNNIYISKNQLTLTGLPSQSETMSGTFHSGTNDQECVSWSGFVSINDVIRICTSQTPTADIRNNLNLSFQEQDIAVSVTNTLPQFSDSDSSVRVNTAVGYGSTSGNKIRRFSNLADNIGTDIEYVDSPTNGATFTIKSSGIYSVSYSDNFSTASRFGISKNASSLTSSLELLTSSEILGVEISASGGQDASISWTGYLVAGDIIRPHTDGGGNSQVIRSSFTISKVGKPNVTGVNVTPFVNVPQVDLTEVRFEGASTRGSTATAIVRFDNNTKSKGSGLLVTSDAINGTVINVLKAGRLTLNTTLVLVNGRFSITRNQQTLSSLTSTPSEILASAEAVGTVPITATAVTDVVVGDIIRISSNVTPSSNNVNNFTVSLSATSDQILTAPESFSTDTASLTYAGSGTYNSTTLANAPVGTFITFTIPANSNALTQTNTPPSQSISSMNTNGIQVFSKAWNAPSTAGNPCRVEIQIGKGLKGRSVDAYAATAKTTVVNYDYARENTTLSSGTLVTYNELTGILTIEAGANGSSSITERYVGVTYTSGFTFLTSAYFVINASKNPALTGLGLNRVAARAVQSSGQSIANSTVTTVIYDSAKIFDTHGALNTATGVFTAPESGYYQASALITCGVSILSGVAFQASFYKNGVQYSLNDHRITATNIPVRSMSDLIFLAKGDTLDVRINQNSGSAVSLIASSTQNFFSITKVSL